MNETLKMGLILLKKYYLCVILYQIACQRPFNLRT